MHSEFISSHHCYVPVFVFTMVLEQMSTRYLRYRSQQRFRHGQAERGTASWNSQCKLCFAASSHVSCLFFRFFSLPYFYEVPNFRPSLVETVNEITASSFRGIVCCSSAVRVRTCKLRVSMETLHTHTHTHTHTHKRNLAIYTEGGYLPRVLGTHMSLFCCIQQNEVSCFLFLSSHHPNIHFENISIYYLPLFNLVAKTSIQGCW